MIDDYCPNREDTYWSQYEVNHCKICMTGVPSNCFGCLYMITTNIDITCVLTGSIILDKHRTICTPHDFTKRLLEIL